MKMQIAALAMMGALAACTAQTTTPIKSMTDTGITVAYYDGFAGKGDTDKVARQHCTSATAEGRAPVTDTVVDDTAVRYGC